MTVSITIHTTIVLYVLHWQGYKCQGKTTCIFPWFTFRHSHLRSCISIRPQTNILIPRKYTLHNCFCFIKNATAYKRIWINMLVLKGLFSRPWIFNMMYRISELQPPISFISAWTQHYVAVPCKPQEGNQAIQNRWIVHHFFTCFSHSLSYYLNCSDSKEHFTGPIFILIPIVFVIPILFSLLLLLL